MKPEPKGFINAIVYYFKSDMSHFVRFSCFHLFFKYKGKSQNKRDFEQAVGYKWFWPGFA